VPPIAKGSLSEQVEEENPKGELANPAGFTWKKAVKMEICM